MADLDQKTLKKLIARRHPEYEGMVAHWDFLQATYNGGRQWFKDHIFRYLKEGDKEYKDRVERAYRFNHTREIVNLVTKYIFRGVVHRNEEDATDTVRRFWKRATLNGADIERFMRYVSDKASIFGRIWVVVDSNATEKVETVDDEKKADVLPYAYIVSPISVLDLSVDDGGELNWILIHEIHRDDEDPIASSGAENSRYRLWTREEWRLFEVTKKGRDIHVEEIDNGEHDLGVVPVFAVDNVADDDSPYSSPSLIGDIAYLDRAVANYLSNLDAIIQDQTFSQLAMPAQGLSRGESAYEKLLEMGTKRIFLYDGADNGKPFFLSPDPKQAEIIVTVIKQIINEIYHSVGVAGERTKQDNSMGIDNSSGVAKAYDFDRVNSLLVAKASSLDDAENKLIRLVNMWAGKDNSDIDLVKYPETFDVRGLADEFAIAAQLAAIQAPATVRREQMQAVIDKLFPRLAEDLLKKMKAELKDWPGEELSIPQGSIASAGGSRNADGRGSKGAQDTGQDK